MQIARRFVPLKIIKKRPTCAKLYSFENFMPQGDHLIAEDTMESYSKLTFSYRVFRL